MSAPLVGAVFGLLAGMGLSVYVARLDLQKQRAGVRTRAEYRGSLLVTPAILAGLGAIVGVAVAAIF